MAKSANQRRIDEANRKRRSEDIETVCKEMGFEYKWMTPYQIRIENIMDAFPTNGKWHFVPADKRGDFDTSEDLFIAMAELTGV